jgi:hypothetical protein
MSRKKTASTRPSPVDTVPTPANPGLCAVYIAALISDMDHDKRHHFGIKDKPVHLSWDTPVDPKEPGRTFATETRPVIVPTYDLDKHWSEMVEEEVVTPQTCPHVTFLDEEEEEEEEAKKQTPRPAAVAPTRTPPRRRHAAPVSLYDF